MQYIKRVKDSNRRDGGNKNNGAKMPLPMPKLIALSFLAGFAAMLAGCSDSLSNADTNQTFSTSLKSYDKTMTPAQRQAAISDMQKEQAARQAAAAQDGTTESVKPAQTQN
jgi:hypothetical protein